MSCEKSSQSKNHTLAPVELRQEIEELEKKFKKFGTK